VGGSGTSSGVPSGGMSAGTVTGGSGTVSAISSGTVSGTGTSGSVVSSGVTSGTAVSASGTVPSSGTLSIPRPTADAGPDSGAILGPVPSAGCGKALTVATGMWVSQPVGCAQGNNNQGTTACQAIPPGSTVPPTATDGSPEYRGWWVYVPIGYDPNKPYTVIYNGAGAFDPNWFDVGNVSYPYFKVDNGQAILVGLDYDTYSAIFPGTYDPGNPESNDLVFMPWLMNEIENTFCVDTTREWMSEYSQYPGSLAQQFDCAFPSKLRGQVLVGGVEPGAPGYPGSLPPCNPAPMAAFFVHDFNDVDQGYASIIPGCSRVLQQNGCTTTSCENLGEFYFSSPAQGLLPPNTTLYVPPAGVVLPARSQCVQFAGCPAQYPVVFCTTYNQSDGDDQSWGVVTLFWNFINGSLPVSPPKPCPAGQGYQGGVCAPCPSGETACNGVCVDKQTDLNNCGACGVTCQTGSCANGSCLTTGDPLIATCTLFYSHLNGSGNCANCANGAPTACNRPGLDIACSSTSVCTNQWCNGDQCQCVGLAKCMESAGTNCSDALQNYYDCSNTGCAPSCP